jgi:hypothetical protein
MRGGIRAGGSDAPGSIGGERREVTMVRKLALIGTFALMLSLLPAVAAAQPGNDDVGNATPVTALPFEDAVDVGDATIEEGEPTEICAPFANTVWYAMTLSEAMEVYIDTAGSNYDTTLAVWVGSSFDDVELVGCNDDTFMGLQAALSVGAEAGVTYLVQVGAFAEAPPEASLLISFGEPPKATGKPFIQKSTFRGKVAEASIEEFDEETGTFAFRSVSLVDGRTQEKGMRPDRFRSIFVDAFDESFDEATGTYSFTGWFGSAELDVGDFSIDKRLRSATVDAEVTLSGETCTDGPEGFECTDLGEVSVTAEVTWDGEGPVVRTKDRSADSFDGARFRFYGKVRSREAVVDGGVVGPVAFELIDARGRISNVAEGFWQFVKTPGDDGFGFVGAEMGFAQAGLATTANVFYERFRNGFAAAFSEEFDEATGAFSYRDVSLMDGLAKTKGGKWMPVEEVWVSSFTDQYDEVSGTRSFTEWYGGGPLIAGSIARNLGGAEVSAEVTLFGYTCTETIDDPPDAECVDLGETTVMVEVTWDGYGSKSTSRYSSTSMTGDEHMRFSGRSTSRAAVANGGVVGDVVGWTYDDADGYIARNAEGTWYKG